MSHAYDGKSLHRFMSAAQPAFEVRGNRIYRCPVAALPEFEIRGEWVYAFTGGAQPVYQIRQGRFLHHRADGGAAVYELR